MDGVVVGWGIATATAVLLAHCGPNRLARSISAYLAASYAFTNLFSFGLTFEQSMQAMAYMDLTAILFLVVLWLRTPSVWLGLIIASLTTQTVLTVVYFLAPHTRDWAWLHIVVKNGLFGLQLAAVAAPTFTPRRKRPVRKGPRRPSATI